VIELITNTYLIGKHLNPDIKRSVISLCGLCGMKEVPGYKMSEVIGSSFMDWDLIDQSASEICVYCSACFGKDIPRAEWLRFTNFIATEKELVKFGREQIWEYLFDPPIPPFIFGVTYSYKKHISFRSPINYSREIYKVQTDEGNAVDIVLSEINEVSQIIQKWYTVCKETKEAPTWFTKRDILRGCSNYKRIEEYGVSEYLEENKLIEILRGTSLLRLLVYALNKK